MAATGKKVDEENCEPQILLPRLCKGLRANNGNLPGASRSASFAAETQSPHGNRDGLRIAPSFESYVEKCLPSVARPLPFGGPARESIYRFSSSRRFYPCKAP